MKLFFIAIIFAASLALSCEALLGGLGQVSPASMAPPQLLQALRGVIKDQFVLKTGQPVRRFYLISFATQVVAGTNYFAKVIRN